MSDTANKIILGVSTGLGLLAAGFALKAGINCRNCKVSFKTLQTASLALVLARGIRCCTYRYRIYSLL